MIGPAIDRARCSAFELFALLPSDEQDRVLAGYSPEQLAALEHDWLWWARPSQLPPPEPWHIWVLLGGRGLGKSRTLSELVIRWSRDSPRVALVARTASDVRDTMVEGESGILARSPEHWRPDYEPSKRRLTWPNGAIATTFSSDEPDMLRGPQFHKAAGDEFASWRYSEALDNLILGLRLGANPQLALATTPKPVKQLRELLTQPGVVVTRGSTHENLQNLAPTFRNIILRRYEGTRLGRQEIYAELLTDTPGALWKRETIDYFRVREAPTDFVRVVVAIDPMSGGARERAGETDDEVGETGIVVVGFASNGHAYVLEDCSVSGDPETWGGAAIAAYHRHQADLIVGEVNNGGEMVGYVVTTLDSRVNFQPVWASRGKATRAEPVSALYVRGLFHHLGVLPELEDELTTWVPGLGTSPNRLDACVWAATAIYYTDDASVDVFSALDDEDRVQISPI